MRGSRIGRVGWLVIVGTGLWGMGCRGHSGQQALSLAQEALPVVFTDATQEAGIHFLHNNGANGEKWLPETMGSGCVFFDFNNDGWPDLYLVNGRDWTEEELRRGGTKRRVPPKGRTTGKLFRNRGDGTFEDVTQQAGLDVEMFGMGCAAGDYDNDGDEDLYVTALGRNFLFRNNGDGTFTEVAKAMGVEDGGWSTSCAFLDYDRDGDLDLFVCHYVVWSPEGDIWCTLDGKHKSYCTPEKYTGEVSQLFRNDGHRFTRVTREAGLERTGEGKRAQGKSLGVAILDYNDDGWLDIAVANDTEPNYLFHNNGDGTFSEVGISAGIAYSETGVARGAMGIDAADYCRCGKPSLLIGNFSNQMLALYHNQSLRDMPFFVDKAPTSEVGRKSRLYLAFGVFFFDYDNDGWLDFFVANGHIEDDIHAVQNDVFYEQEPLVFRNLGTHRQRGREETVFRFVGEQLGEAMQRRIVGRGAAYADYDLDGDVDILVTTNGGPAYLLRNEGGHRHRKLRLELRGHPLCSAIGAKVKVHLGREVQTYMVRSGSSYCSQSELPLTIGLGRAEKVDLLEVLWPDGRVETFPNLAADQRLRIVEGKGIVSQEGFPPPRGETP